MIFLLDFVHASNSCFADQNLERVLKENRQTEKMFGGSLSLSDAF